MSTLLIGFSLWLLGTPIEGKPPAENAITYTAAPFRGEWRQIDLTGFRSWDDGRCTMQLFQERLYNLQPFSMNELQLLGTYTSVNHGRFLRNEGDCRLEGELEPQLLSATIRTWQLDGKIEPTTGDARLRATYQSCMNLGCGDEELSREDFTTTLRRIDDTRLLDTGTSAAKDDDLVFLRTPKAQALAEAAAREVAELLRPLREGQFNRFYKKSLSKTWRNTLSWQAAKTMTQPIGPLLVQAEARSLVEARYANRWVTEDMRLDRPFAFLVHSLGLPGGRVVLETITLELEEDGWKLAGLWYAGG